MCRFCIGASTQTHEHLGRCTVVKLVLLYGSTLHTYIHCMMWAVCVEWYHPISGALFIAASQLMPSRRTSHAQCSYHIQSIIALFSSTITVLHVYISLMKSVYLCIHYCEDMWVSTQLYSSFLCIRMYVYMYFMLHSATPQVLSMYVVLRVESRSLLTL